MALDKDHLLLAKPIMYNENVPFSSTHWSVLALNNGDIDKQTDLYSNAISRYPTLKKALYFKQQFSTSLNTIAHQADWIASKISGNYQNSDYHNCLKLGYLPAIKQWHSATTTLINKTHLPTVNTPGKAICKFSNTAFGLNNVLLTAGTTDSNAAFIASGIHQFGQALSSLGTTLVLKVYSPTAIESEQHGVYSHKYKEGWIVSGASNCGAGILKNYFTDEEITRLSDCLQPEKSTNLKYYPLQKAGERFPVYAPEKQPVLMPKAKNNRIFFQAILESLAKIESDGYQLLHQLGAPKVTHIFSAGGGASNLKWQKIRSQYCQVEITQAAQTEAAFGTALLALAGYNSQNK